MARANAGRARRSRSRIGRVVVGAVRASRWLGSLMVDLCGRAGPTSNGPVPCRNRGPSGPRPAPGPDRPRCVPRSRPRCARRCATGRLAPGPAASALPGACRRPGSGPQHRGRRLRPARRRGLADRPAGLRHPGGRSGRRRVRGRGTAAGAGRGSPPLRPAGRMPGPREFPRSALAGRGRKALTAAPTAALRLPGPAAGGPSCARRWPTYLARARGVRPPPEQIVICSGFTQALTLLSPGAAGGLRGRQVWPSRRMAAGSTATWSPRPGSAPSRCRRRRRGGRGQPAGRHRRRGRAADPGAPVPARRAAGPAAPGPGRAQWAAGHRRPGHRGRLRRRVPLRPAAASARCRRWRPSLVVYAGTASKSLAPALGLAWLVVPPG